ncbi:MAG: hypothetical protein HOP23_14855 [Methylococcaceae bacterium]|nr:hypothetical protein [Methylococcaceae bacterium]
MFRNGQSGLLQGMFSRVAVLLLGLFICTSCTHSPLQQHHDHQQRSEQENPLFNDCKGLFDDVERRIAEAGVVDSEAARIPGHPYLRVNRFLASLRYDVHGEAFEAWVDQLQKLAFDGLQIELRNLPVNAGKELQSRLKPTLPGTTTLAETLQQCSRTLRTKMLDEPAEQAVLREQSVVPSEYKLWQRAVGFYPITALAFRLGIKRWHVQTLETFRRSLAKLPIAGQLARYVPDQASSLNLTAVAEIIEKSSLNWLNSPLPSLEDEKRLFDRFAPIFEIDVASDDDRPGVPTWHGAGKLIIDTTHPAVYRHLSHSRLGKQVLLQLNYTLWFPARTKTTGIDLLAGQLDGITWRVTLLPDGRPWVFDTIHNCGCYHLFFPSQYAKKLEQASLLNEPAFTPQQQITVDDDKQLVIRIAAGTHYVERVYSLTSTPLPTIKYGLLDADDLRSLALSDGTRRSLFGEDGLVAGTERAERFLFWPMGIPSPGAMRQWGHHATAFVGSRHFDDPYLLEQNFGVVQRHTE